MGGARPGVRVQGARLPVHWGAAGPALARLLAERPRWVLLLGLAARATEIRVEMQAMNVGGPIPDNAGALPPAPDLLAAARPSRASTFPGPRSSPGWRRWGCRWRCPPTPGSICATSPLYHALTWAAAQNPPPAVGFIHLPPLAVLSLADEIHAVRLAIATIVGAGARSTE